MAARTKTKVSPKYKTKYRVKNWAAYDIALRDRGDITVWFDDEAIYEWNALPSGRPGGQRRYSDLAIVTALTLRKRWSPKFGQCVKLDSDLKWKDKES